MRNCFFFLCSILLVEGVSGDEKYTVTTSKGDSITLKADVDKIKKGDLIVLKFEEDVISKLQKTDGDFSSINDFDLDEKFKDRLMPDYQTGSLTIKNIRTEHAGLYRLEMKIDTEEFKSYNVTVVDVSGVNADGLKSMLRMIGDYVSLYAGVTKIQKNDHIQLKFKSSIIACLNCHAEERWSNIHLNSETGELAIKNIQSNQTGVYEVTINTSSMILYRIYNITVSDVETLSVTEGDSFIIQTGVPNILKDDQMKLKFEDKYIITDRLKDAVDENWRNIFLNGQTGGIEIGNIRIYQSGDYEVNTSSKILNKKFRITVAVPDPGWSSTAVAGIVVVVVLVLSAATGVFYCLHKKLQNSPY